MLCFRCGAQNAGQPKLCGKCGVILPRNMDGVDAPASVLQLDDGADLSLPETTYPNRPLQRLERVLDEFWDEECEIEDVESAIGELENRLAELLDDLPSLMQSVESQKEFRTDGVPQRIGFLLNYGIQKFNLPLENLYRTRKSTLSWTSWAWPATA